MAAILHFRPCRRRILQSSISSIHFYSSNSDDNNHTKNVSALEEIRKNLSQLRHRTNVPPPPPPPPSSSSSPPLIFFQELYKRNVMPKSDQVSGSSGPGLSGSKPASLDSIRMSLNSMKPNPAASQLQSRLSGRRDDIGLNLRPKIGNGMPESFNKKDVMSSDETTKTEFVRMYSFAELRNKFLIAELSESWNASRETDTESRNCHTWSHVRERLKKTADYDKYKNTFAGINISEQQELELKRARDEEAQLETELRKRYYERL